ncbi:molybdenum cofactor guanylyltransferase [Methanobrevibacter sp. OttesenSCG-928-I08]|nr:molybdenum cofactor guanylyltransferase [Methanobrevibacter sp. OttesenSCG-928-I08]
MIKMTSCVLLCGGMSRRMGQDKGSMKISDKPMIIHILDSLNNIINELVIVLNDEKRILEYEKIIDETQYNYSIKIIEDEIKDKGPLSGIMTGLKNITGEYALVIPCDSPFISTNFINFMINKEKSLNKDALIIYHPTEHDDSIKTKITNSEPLHSIYSKKLYKNIFELIKNNTLDVKSLIKKINCEFIKIDNKNILKKDVNNLNTPEDVFKN